MSLRDVLGVSQDANAFEDAPCTDLTLKLWDPQLEWETAKDARHRQEMGAQLCREVCPAVVACEARRDRLHAAGRKTDGVWAGRLPGRVYVTGRRTGCGSDAGYQAHRRAGEEACEPCAVAHRECMREYMARRRGGAS